MPKKKRELLNPEDFVLNRAPFRPLNDFELKAFFKKACGYAPFVSRFPKGKPVCLPLFLVPDWIRDGSLKQYHYFVVGDFGDLIYSDSFSSNDLGKFRKPDFSVVENCKDPQHPRECRVFRTERLRTKKHFQSLKYHLYPHRFENGQVGFKHSPDLHTFYVMRFILDFGIPVTEVVNMVYGQFHFEEEEPYIDVRDRFCRYLFCNKLYMDRSVADFWLQYTNYAFHPLFGQGINRVHEVFLRTETGANWQETEIHKRFNTIRDACGLSKWIHLKNLRDSCAEKTLKYTGDVLYTMRRFGLDFYEVEDFALRLDLDPKVTCKGFNPLPFQF